MSDLELGNPHLQHGDAISLARGMRESYKKQLNRDMNIHLGTGQDEEPIVNKQSKPLKWHLINVGIKGNFSFPSADTVRLASASACFKIPQLASRAFLSKSVQKCLFICGHKLRITYFNCKYCLLKQIEP